MSTGSGKAKATPATPTVADDVPPWERQPAGDVNEAAPAMTAEEIRERADAKPQGGTVNVWDAEAAEAAMSPTARVQLLMQYLANKAAESEGDSQDAIMSMLADVMAADTAEGVLGGNGTTPAEEIIGMPVRLVSVKFRESELAGEIPFYAILTVFRSDTRMEDVVTCGGFKVVAQLARLDMLSQLEGKVVRIMRSERPTKAGNFPLHLEWAV